MISVSSVRRQAPARLAGSRDQKPTPPPNSLGSKNPIKSLKLMTWKSRYPMAFTVIIIDSFVKKNVFELKNIPSVPNQIMDYMSLENIVGKSRIWKESFWKDQEDLGKFPFMLDNFSH